MRCAAVALGLLSTLLAMPLSAQSPPATAVLEGEIVNADTGAPIPRARVKIEAKTADFYAKTDPQGHFAFAPLPTGMYTWSVESPGFLPVERVVVNLGAANARAAPGKRVIEAAQLVRSDGPDGLTHFQVKAPLTAYAVIAGRVTDSSGVPAEDCPISVVPQQSAFTRSIRTFSQLASGSRTDEKGEFRIGGLPPGTYYVSAGGRRGGATSFRTTYFPGSLDRASAKPIALAAGQSTHADIQLVQLSGVRITGRVEAPPDAPAGAGRIRTQISLVPASTATSQERYSTAVAPGKGSYLLENVLPGKYTLMAVTSVQQDGARSRDAKNIAGLEREVEVGNQNIGDLDLTQQPLHDIEGTVTFAPGCSPRPLQLAVRPKGAAIGSRAAGDVMVGADGKFVVPGPGVGAFALVSIGAVRLNSAHLGERDVLRDGLVSPAAGNDPLLVTVGCIAAIRRLP